LSNFDRQTKGVNSKQSVNFAETYPKSTGDCNTSGPLTPNSGGT
jgi:hypothetical protein